MITAQDREDHDDFAHAQAFDYGDNMADEPNSGWHLSDNGLKAILAAIGVLTLLVQSYFAVRVEGLHNKVSTMQESVDKLKAPRPPVYAKE